MKIAVIGANGRLGTKVTKQALDRGHQVKGFIYTGDSPDERVERVNKSLFNIEWEDIANVDVVISAFGSGFDADPTINKEAFLKYISLLDKKLTPLVAIGGAGSLYTDSSHTEYVYQHRSHPDFLRGISMNIKLGIDELKKTQDMEWTVVCPSEQFDFDGPLTGKYIVGTQEHLIYNEDGKSYVSYEDLAKAMIDIAESGTYRKMKITVATK